jgi:hypothetical protein
MDEFVSFVAAFAVSSRLSWLNRKNLYVGGVK